MPRTGVDRLAREALGFALRPPQREAVAEAAHEPFAVGARVRHEEWGEGTVQRYEADAMVVLFDDAGYRTLAVELVSERGLLVEE